MTRNDLDAAANNAKHHVDNAHRSAFAAGNGNTRGATNDLNNRFDDLIDRYCAATPATYAALIAEFNALAADAAARTAADASRATAILFAKAPRGRVR
jgi:hypothetical protein